MHGKEKCDGRKGFPFGSLCCCSPSTVRGPHHFWALGGQKLLSSGQQGGAGNKWEEGWPRNKLIPSKMMPQGTTCLQPVSTSQAPFR